VLKFSQKPLFFDRKLSRRARSLLALAVPVHLALCVWTFGSFNLLEDPRGVDLDAHPAQQSGQLAAWRAAFRRCTRFNSLPFAVLLAVAVSAYLLAAFANSLGDLLHLLLAKLFRCKSPGAGSEDSLHFCERVQDSHKRDEEELFAKQTQGQGLDARKFPRLDPVHPSVCSEPYEGQVDLSLRLLRLQYYSKTSRRHKKFKIVPSYDFAFHPDYRQLLISRHA